MEDNDDDDDVRHACEPKPTESENNVASEVMYANSFPLSYVTNVC